MVVGQAQAQSLFVGGVWSGNVSPTSATVVAQRPATVLFLAREYVDRIVSAMPEIKNYLEALAEDREIDNQLMLGEDETPADERILI